jgi:hypothetical protein
MSNTVVYSAFNGFPGSQDTYDDDSGAEIPILPDVNLYNSFNFELKATSVAARSPTTQDEGAGDYSRSSNFRTTGVRNGSSTGAPNGGNYYNGIHVARIPTRMYWVDDQGPEGNAICQSEIGDWFTRDVLAKPDGQGGGVEFIENAAPAGTFLFTFNTSSDGGGDLQEDSHSFTVNNWNTLSVKGGYNASVFCRNEFGYTNDYEGGTYEVKSLYELPEKFDNLYKFIPDQREFTTLTFKIKVDWALAVHYGAYQASISSSQQNSVLSDMGYNSSGATGTDTHVITHVVNNSNNDYNKILNDLLNDRQRTPEEQRKRYNQTFVETSANMQITTPSKIQ